MGEVFIRLYYHLAVNRRCARKIRRNIQMVPQDPERRWAISSGKFEIHLEVALLSAATAACKVQELLDGWPQTLSTSTATPNCLAG